MASGYSDLSEIHRSGISHGKPAKINLLDERRRRESLVEQQLSTAIVRTHIAELPQMHQQVEQNQQQVQQSHDYQRSHGLRSADVNYPYITSGSAYNYHSLSNTEPIPGVQSGNYENRDDSIGERDLSRQRTQSYLELERELAGKEAKIKREVAYANQYQYNPWSRPRQIREPRKEAPARITRNGQRWVKECPSTSASRPTSRASSTRSNTEADLVEKAARLLIDADELVKKPLNSQQILINSGLRSSQTTDFGQADVGSIHTAVIKEPRHEVDNKSPLPFAYDNFSTLGIRGNIASVGAAEPETPYPPIFPTIKRSG